jgi:hypothetical protein
MVLAACQDHADGNISNWTPLPPERGGHLLAMARVELDPWLAEAPSERGL